MHESRPPESHGTDRLSPADTGGEEVPPPEYWWSQRYVDSARRLLGPAICDRLGVYELPGGFRLSVIVPIYNELGTLEGVISRLRGTGLPLQIIVVDDGSDDGSSESLRQYEHDADVELHRHIVNRGKGSAIRTAIEVARGDVVVIQDADDEYDPQDFRWLLQPILAGRADIVYGTRYGHADRELSPWWHNAANGLISLFASLAVGLRLSDVETCYKMGRREHFEAIRGQLRESRFGIEIELTARWARRGLRFTERPIRYQHRWYDEGKKIGWRDGVRALWCILKYGVFRR